MDFNANPYDDLSQQELQYRDIVAPHMCLQHCREVVATVH